MKMKKIIRTSLDNHKKMQKIVRKSWGNREDRRKITGARRTCMLSWAYSAYSYHDLWSIVQKSQENGRTGLPVLGGDGGDGRRLGSRRPQKPYKNIQKPYKHTKTIQKHTKTIQKHTKNHTKTIRQNVFTVLSADADASAFCKTRQVSWKWKGVGGSLACLPRAEPPPRHNHKTIARKCRKSREES